VENTELKKTLVQWRHDLHRYPETAFEEKNTAAYVAEKLRSLGLKTETKIGGTGVVATLQAGCGSRTIGIRADMDALNLSEISCHDHVSAQQGKMHGCGHDGHTATLLGAALLLSSEPSFNGTVRFVFQPAEEPGKGAQAMIDDGLFERFPMDEIYGLHNAPFLPAGTVNTRIGGIAASEDDFTIRITGKGGHASGPHLANDPQMSAAEIYMALQTIVSRNANPVHPLVVSCTEIETDGIHNAMPTHVEIRGDARSTSPEDQKLIEDRMRSICEGICTMNGMKCDFRYTHEFYPVVNDKTCTAAALQAAVKCLGQDRVNGDCEPWMASEDFAAFLKKVPGCFLLLGSGPDADPAKNTPLHNPAFDYNDEILADGARLWEALVRERLA